ncbi:MAG TPA: trehalose-6-phosphate synthase [Burkholderiaceae bacterium]|jgi:trehalose 6-phosphate synthase|nr:trehalose-6-phosphate synthase [Burkholderiaceae bacterium]
MRLSLRSVLPLGVALGLMAYAVVPLVDSLTLRWFMRDLDVRSALIASTMQDALLEDVATSSRYKTVAYLTKITQDDRFYAIGLCENAGSQMIATKSFPRSVTCRDLDRFSDPGQRVLATDHGTLHVSVRPIAGETGAVGRLILVHDMSFIQRRSHEAKQYLLYFFVALAVIVSLITVVMAELSRRGLVQGMQAMLRGEGWRRPTGRTGIPELRPIERDLRELMRDVRSEVQMRDEAQLAWAPETLRQILRQDLRGEEVIVVSNREPYLHERRDGRIEVRRPASGLVTALEPIMRACSGTWIAHGSGSADRDMVDRHDRVAVPPEHPAYQIRRLWLTAEEEAGYYYGFANEGLWPLCHIAHVRPVFRSTDWDHYVAVNQKFAQAVVEEANSTNPIVLVQDYHFALLPRMIRERLPEATIIAFWHIPWPNPEAFAICPWRAEILEGLLGSSILGFHTQFHCNNFVDTVDRMLEARVDRESFIVTHGGAPTAIKRYPISIEWPLASESLKEPVEVCRADIRQRNALPEDHLLGIGVDRLDYTKGILERFRAIERLLELEPQWIGKFSFIQIAAPSRSSIPEYQSFEMQVRTLATRINARFTGDGPPPIILKVEHHEPEKVYQHYRAADLCYVSSLHDGMNLVAKEFVACRDDERGVLVLSHFTGASRELPEALVVNPYDIDQCARALHLALGMPPAQQRQRMRLMRALIQQFNVYRWAGRMLLDAAGMRLRRHVLGGPRAIVRPLRREPLRVASR